MLRGLGKHRKNELYNIRKIASAAFYRLCKSLKCGFTEAKFAFKLGTHFEMLIANILFLM